MKDLSIFNMIDIVYKVKIQKYKHEEVAELYSIKDSVVKNIFRKIK